jgi:hypothetical protein
VHVAVMDVPAVLAFSISAAGESEHACSATKHYSVWGRCAFRPAGKGARRRSAFQDLVGVSLIVAD